MTGIHWVMRCIHCDLSVKWDANKGVKGGWKHKPSGRLGNKACDKLKTDDDVYRSWETNGKHEIKKVDPPYEQE